MLSSQFDNYKNKNKNKNKPELDTKNPTNCDQNNLNMSTK